MIPHPISSTEYHPQMRRRGWAANEPIADTNFNVNLFAMILPQGILATSCNTSPIPE